MADTPAAQPVAALPAEAAPAQTAEAAGGDSSLLLWGGAGLLILGGIGLAFALRRGRKAVDDEPVLAPSQPIAQPRRPAPVRAEPVAMRESAPLAAAPAAATPGMGRHEAAALRGPTAENPFATRRARLKRAHFLDYHEQRAGRGANATATAAPTAPRPAPATVAASPTPSMSDRVRGTVRSVADTANWQIGSGMKPSYSG